MPDPPTGRAWQAGPPGLVPRLGRTLTCEEGQGSRVDNAELGPGVIPPPLERGEGGHEGSEVADWEQGSREQAEGRPGGCRGDSEHSPRLPRGQCPGRSACAAPRSSTGGQLPGWRERRYRACLPAPHTPGPSLLAPGPSDLPLSVWVRIPITTY